MSTKEWRIKNFKKIKRKQKIYWKKWYQKNKQKKLMQNRNYYGKSKNPNFIPEVPLPIDRCMYKDCLDEAMIYIMDKCYCTLHMKTIEDEELASRRHAMKALLS